jgi:transcriptional regulator with XRE-family HTH domain
MVSFGKKLRECREAKGFSQQEPAKKPGSAHTVIGRYEMLSVIDSVRKLADALDTIVGVLLGEANDILKNPKMMKRLSLRRSIYSNPRYIYFGRRFDSRHLHLTSFNNIPRWVLNPHSDGLLLRRQLFYMHIRLRISKGRDIVPLGLEPRTY